MYSKQENAGFCLPCVLFASFGYRGTNPGVLVNRPLTVFTKALEILHKHTEKAYHKQVVVGFEGFMRVMRHEQTDIRSRLSQALTDRMACNRQKLSSIFKTVVFCGRQNRTITFTYRSKPHEYTFRKRHPSRNKRSCLSPRV